MTITPGFWLQQSFTNAHEIVDVAADLDAETAVRPGVVLVPVNVESTLRKLYIEARKEGDVFIDPGGWWIDRDPKKMTKKNYPWLDAEEPRPSGANDWKDWMEQSVEHQLSTNLRGTAAEPVVLVTPSPYLQAHTGSDELYDIVDAAKDVRAGSSSSLEFWLGIAVDREYLRQERHLTDLLNTIVSAGFVGIVFRGFHNQVPPISDARLLEGLRELVESCYAADVKVFLPNSGWVGWLGMAWGAHGFSGGLSKSSWFDRWPAPMNNPPKHESIFEWMVIRHVRTNVLPGLVGQTGYLACTCPACRQMNGQYEADQASRHQIWVAHRESTTLVPLDHAGRHAHVKRHVEEAISFRDSLSTTTQQRVAASFLDTWAALL